MWPFIIAGFTILLVLLLFLVGVRWQYALHGEPWTRDANNANPAGMRITTPIQRGNNWWDRKIGIQGSIGLLLIVNGLWHAASPWINLNPGVTTATVSSFTAGPALGSGWDRLRRCPSVAPGCPGSPGPSGCGC